LQTQRGKLFVQFYSSASRGTEFHISFYDFVVIVFLCFGLIEAVRFDDIRLAFQTVCV
jgi:hypothetical protein